MTIRTPQFGTRVLRQPADWALFLYGLTAILGALVAARRDAALSQLALIAAALVVYLFFYHLARKSSGAAQNQYIWFRWILVALPVAFAVYFLLTNDWSGRIGKIVLLDPVLRLFAVWQPHDTVYQLNSNAAGGVIASLIPLQVVALRGLRNRRPTATGVALLTVSGVGLVLSESRGAWFALLFIGVMWVAWKLVQYAAARWPFLKSAARMSRGAVLAAVSLSAVCIVTLTPLGAQLLSLRPDRVEIWRNSLDLLSDYPLTGVGLGNFGITYSSYVALVHVIDFTYAHNLYLDIWLAQGLPGIVAFIILVILAVTRARTGDWWQTAALASLGIILLHGLTDDAFYGYEGRALPFLLIPFALLLAPAVLPVNQPVGYVSPLWPLIAMTAGAIFTLIAIALSPHVRAVFLSNLAALMQNQAELSIYEWPKWPIQDAIRRELPDAMAPVMSTYRAALQADAMNATANRRLGQIELSMGEYDAACEHLYSAYARQPSQRATRQLAGECYAINGDVNKAAKLWQTIDVGEGQLDARLWWYSQYLRDTSRSALMVEAIRVYHQR